MASYVVDIKKDADSRLDAIAKSESKSKADVVAEAVAEYIQRRQPQAQQRRVVEVVRSASGRFRPTLSDRK